MEKNILIIAGEPSGDMRAGELLKELKPLLPDPRFWGIGGDHMEQEGVFLIEHVAKHSMVGAIEVIKNLSMIRKQYTHLLREIKERKPSLAILVDYPGFNLRVAAFLHQQGIPVIYYVIPQVWAWGRNRVRNLKSHIDEALVLFEFEKKFLEKHGIESEFVGHPLVDKIAGREDRDTRHDRFTIALLPGSRKTEIITMFPVMLEAAERIRKYREDINFVIAENSNIDSSLYESALACHEGLSVSRVKDDTFSCLERSDFAIVTSGTATLETAVMGKPMIVTYRANLITYILFRLVVRIPYLGLVNIIARKGIVPEMLQGNATAEKLSKKTLEIISSDSRMRKMKEELKKVRDSLGEKGSSRRAAEAIKRFWEEKGL